MKQTIEEKLFRLANEYLGAYGDDSVIKNHNDNLRFRNTKPFDGINSDHDVVFNCRYIDERNDEEFNNLMKFNQHSKFKNYIIVGGKYGIKLMRKYLIRTRLEYNVSVLIIDDDDDIEEYVCSGDLPNYQIIYGCDTSYANLKHELTSYDFVRRFNIRIDDYDNRPLYDMYYWSGFTYYGHKRTHIKLRCDNFDEPAIYDTSDSNDKYTIVIHVKNNIDLSELDERNIITKYNETFKQWITESKYLKHFNHPCYDIISRYVEIEEAMDIFKVAVYLWNKH